MNRSLAWPDCQNARDLGGLPTPGGPTRSHALVRSDTLANLTPEGVAAVERYGVRTVIDLRSPAEALSSPNPFGRLSGWRGMKARLGLGDSRTPQPGRVRYRLVPLVDDAEMNRLTEAKTMFERYVMILERRQAAFRQAFCAIADSDGAVVFHCFAGKDRTGLMAALLLAAAGLSEEAIAGDFAESDRQLAASYDDWVAAAPPEKREQLRDDLRCPPERMLRVLDHICRRWGSPLGYLEAAGITPEQIGRVRARLA